MEDIEKLKRQRKTVRAACTRLTNATKDLLDAIPIDSAKLNRHRAQLLNKGEILKVLDGQIYNMIDDEKEAENDLEQADVYQERIIDQIEDINQKVEIEKQREKDVALAAITDDNQRKLEAAMTAQMAINQQAIAAQIAAQMNALQIPNAGGGQPNDHETGIVKLPILHMNKYNGDPTKWYEFWSGFEIGVESHTKLKPKAKLVYLKTLLEGPAASVVAGLAPTDANYETAKTLLINRFGKKSVIINAHLRALDRVQPVKKYNDLAGLRQLHDDFELHVRCLENLEVEVSTFGALLSPKLMAAIPDVIANGFAQEDDDDESDIKLFLLYLNKQISLRERTADANQYQKEGSSEEKKVVKTTNFKDRDWSKKKISVPSVSALIVSATECIFCDVTAHLTDACPLPPHKRRRNCMRAGRCFLCLERKHRVPDCTTKNFCAICNRRHHTFLHEADDEAQVTAVIEHNNPDLYFQVMMVNVESQTRRKTVQCFFDSGSHRTFITEKLATELGAQEIGTRQMNIVPFGEIKSQPAIRKQVRVSLGARNGDPEKLEIHAIVVPWITGSVAKPANTNVRDLMRARGIELEIEPEDCQKGEVAILVGVDYFWQIVTGQIERLGPGLVGLQTMFGWTVLGSTGAAKTQDRSLTVQVNAITFEDKLDRKLQQFWELDTLGILHESNTGQDDANDQALIIFHRSLRWTGERYTVRLPWLVSKSELDDNYTIALRRFWNLVRKFKSDPEMYKQYAAVINGQLEDHILEDVPSIADDGNTCYYLPHSPVIRENKETTKLRVVCDASSRGAKSRSLNDCLFTGPNLLPELINVLIHFRIFRFAATGDVEKAFHQIEIDQEDRDCLRIFWLQKEWDGKGPVQLRPLRYTRVLFGATPSPFLLNATIRDHIQKFQDQYPDMVAQVNCKFYVDDFIDSQPDETKLEQTCLEVTKVLKEANMTLTKWISNSPRVQQTLTGLTDPAKDVTKVLGLNWTLKPDFLTLEMGEILELCLLNAPTKRQVIRLVASVFDPLGFVNPFTVTGKLIFQSLWKLKSGWDEPLPEEESSKWTLWKQQIPHLVNIKVPRWLGCDLKEKNCEVHLFCDASPLAYGVVVYIKTGGQRNNDISFILSKSRIAPVKTVTLPRLELMGAVLLSRLIIRLNKLSATRIVAWTDSTIVLAWLARTTGRTDPFVTRRVEEIRINAPQAQWRHVPGKENPADLLTRGLDVLDLVDNQVWWKGPRWLMQDEHHWPATEDTAARSEVEEDDAVNLNLDRHESIEPILDPSDQGCWTRLTRVTGWVMRYVTNLKEKTRNGNSLTIEEITRAEKYWIRFAQRETYSNEFYSLKLGRTRDGTSELKQVECTLDTDDLIRVRPRVNWGEIKTESAGPWILPEKHHLTGLIVRHAHQQVYHGGLGDTLAEIRCQFWIPHARSCVKRLIKNCFVCKRVQGRLAAQIEAPLPLDRTQKADPFQVVGIDFAGPLYPKKGNKSYILIFTCGVTRAIHLELTTSMSTEDFVLALRRFFARRGVPTTIYSDNAKTFKRADAELRVLMNQVRKPDMSDFLTRHRIHWKFIVERAAWWGGFWERMVRSVKVSLKKILGKQALTFEELTTTLCEIEAMLNSRPLSYVSGDATEREPLTPSHFLVGRRLVTLPGTHLQDPKQMDARSAELLKRWKLREHTLKQYWNRWRREYLTELRVFKTTHEKLSIKELDVVLIQDENQPRSTWQMGQVTEAFVGRDGKIRSCAIRLTNGKSIRRPVQRLCILESHE